MTVADSKMLRCWRSVGQGGYEVARSYSSGFRMINNRQTTAATCAVVCAHGKTISSMTQQQLSYIITGAGLRETVGDSGI